MYSITGLSLTLEKLYPAIREVLTYIVPSTSNGKMGCGGWHGSARHCSLLTMWALCGLPAAWGTDTTPSVSALHGQIQQFLWKLPLQERDLPWRYYFASVREGFLDSSLWKENCKQMVVFSSYAAKSCLKQFCPQGRTYERYTPVPTSCNLLGKNHSGGAGSLLQSDSLTMFILHYDAGLVHSLPNYYHLLETLNWLGQEMLTTAW